MESFYTHREYLKNELLKFDYTNTIKCLEFGTGDGSAVIFKELTDKYENLSVTSYESDFNWLTETKNKYENNNYNFIYTESWDDLLNEENFNDVYDLVFVDQSPWEVRIKTIDLLKNKTKVLILHDFDFYNKGVCDDIFSIGSESFFHKKYNDVFTMVTHIEQLPPTLIMINKHLKLS